MTDPSNVAIGCRSDTTIQNVAEKIDTRVEKKALVSIILLSYFIV